MVLSWILLLNGHLVLTAQFVPSGQDLTAGGPRGLQCRNCEQEEGWLAGERGTVRWNVEEIKLVPDDFNELVYNSYLGT